MEWEKAYVSFYWFTLQMPATAGLGQGKSKKRPNRLGHAPLLPRVHNSRKLEVGVEPAAKQSCSNTDCGSLTTGQMPPPPPRCFTQCIKFWLSDNINAIHWEEMVYVLLAAVKRSIILLVWLAIAVRKIELTENLRFGSMWKKGLLMWSHLCLLYGM